MGLKESVLVTIMSTDKPFSSAVAKGIRAPSRKSSSGEVSSPQEAPSIPGPTAVTEARMPASHSSLGQTLNTVENEASLRLPVSG